MLNIQTTITNNAEFWGNECDDETANAAAEKLAEMLTERLDKQYTYDDITVAISPSEGITRVHDEDGTREDIALQIANWIAANWTTALDAVLS